MHIEMLPVRTQGMPTDARWNPGAVDGTGPQVPWALAHGGEEMPADTRWNPGAAGEELSEGLVLHGSTGFYRVLQGSTEFYRVLKGSTGFYRFLQGSTGFYRVLQGSGSTGFWFYRVLALHDSGSTGLWLYRALVLQVSTGFYRDSPCSQDQSGLVNVVCRLPRGWEIAKFKV